MNDPQQEETFADTERKLREIITTLRAQLAEAEACNRGLVRLNEAIQARAERAEAALAAQIEADAWVDPEKFLELVIYAAKEAREKALREAANSVQLGDTVQSIQRRILALIEKEQPA